MALRTIDFDSGTDGATVAAGGDIASVTGTPTYSAADKIHGTNAMRASGATTSAIRVSVGATALSHSGSVYIKPTGVAGTGVARVVQFDDTLFNGLGSIRLHNDGHVDIAAGATRQVASSLSWVDGAPLRLDWQYNNSTSPPTVRVDIFTSNIEGVTPNETITGQITAGTLGRWQFGDQGGDADTVIVTDTIRINDGLFAFGPFQVNATVTPGIASVSASAPFDTTGGSVDLTLTADLPVQVTAAALNPTVFTKNGVRLTPIVAHFTPIAPTVVVGKFNVILTPIVAQFIPIEVVTTIRGKRVFRGPTRIESWPITPDARIAVKVTINQTLYRKNGVWLVGENLNWTDLVGVDRLYQGGATPELTDEQLDELAAAGLSQYIAIE